MEVDMAATARLEFRVSPEDRARIERAAALLGEPPSTFARAAAEERAERVLREQTTTTVPAKFFDDLMAALDAPARPNAALAEAGRALRDLTRD
jgi:uncharacterized protein (DUF1778 family)